MSHLANLKNEVKKAAQLLKKSDSFIDQILNPERIVKVSFLAGSKLYHGYRVQWSSLRGPYKGGIRFHHEVNEEEVQELAFLMTLKNSLAGLPLGGGKGGVVCNPKNETKEQVGKIAKGFAKALLPNIGPYTDIPAPDVNTGAREMDIMAKEYSRLTNTNDIGVVTGKSVDKGGLEGREEATALGGVYVLQEILPLYNKKKVSDTTVAVQGFGNVGAHIARLLSLAGYKIVAVSDSKTSVIDNEGLDIDRLVGIKNKTGTLKHKELPIHDTDDVLYQKVDVLIPAALGGQITGKNMSKVKAKFILEMANGAISLQAEEKMQKNQVIIPDILANAGGVIVSYFEWLQNTKNKKWQESEVNTTLKDYISRAVKETVKSKKKFNVSWRRASIITALQNLK